MSVQRKFLIIAAQFFLIALFLLWFARSLTEDIRLLDRYWKSHSGQIKKKADAIHQLSQRFGYGGFIHHFKNLVLRGLIRTISLDLVMRWQIRMPL